MSDDFWSSRPVLEHILTLARARRVGPWAVLGNAMVRAVATIPPDVALPGLVGGRMSLNLFVASVGPSGAGKGGADAAALDGIAFTGPPILQVPLGSGEGTARTFRPWGTPPEADNPVTAAVFTCPEIDTLTALTARQGSTLSAELRKLYSGESLGFANAGKDTRNVVANGSYRACLSAGVQPLRAQTLLGAADGGLPQRFVWFPTADLDAPDTSPSDPGRLTVKTPAWSRTTPGHLRAVGANVDLEVPAAARASIDAHRLAVLRQEPTVDPLDGHALLCQLKVAVALMALEGRTLLSEDDWQLATFVMNISGRTREHCRIALNERFRHKTRARAMATAEHDEIVSERKAQRAREAILRRLANHPEQTRAELNRALKVDIRDYLDSALSDLLDQQGIAVSPGRRGTQKVHVYARYTPREMGSISGDEPCTGSPRVPLPSGGPTPQAAGQREPSRDESRHGQQAQSRSA